MLLLRIATPSGKKPLYASQFRELLAKGGDGSALLPPRFFHYAEDGRTLSGKPDIRVVGGSRWVGVLSQSGDSSLIDAATGTAARLVSEHFDTPVPIQIERPEFGVRQGSDASGGICHYFLRDMAIKRRTNARRTKDDASLVKDLLLAGLAEIAETYGFDLPPDRALGFDLHELRCIGMQLGTTKGETREAVTLANASFSLRADLAGIWQVGHLQSRGYGRIVPRVAGSMLSSRPGVSSQGVLK